MSLRPLGRCVLLAAIGVVGIVGTVVLLPDPTAAHEIDPSIATVIDEVSPRVEGLDISIGTSVTTQVLVVNNTDEVLEVLADTGEAFLRISPGGVEANLASPSWYLTNQPFGADRPPAGVDAGAPARWAAVADEPAWGWFDHRLHPEAVISVLGEERERSFTIPMRLGSTPLEVRGHLEQRASAPSFSAALTAVPPASTGVAVQLLQGRAPGLFVRYDGTGTVVIDGADGEPFVRLSPSGAEINRRSPTWFFTAQARGDDVDGLRADASAPPEWEVVGGGPSIAWLDPRALIDEVGSSSVTVDWEIPLEVDAVSAVIAGTSTVDLVTLARPADDSASDRTDGSRIPLVVAASAATVVAAAALARFRRSR